jgi:preprotein translocase subunit SecB
LRLTVSIKDKEDSFTCQIICRGEFTFKPDGDIIPEYFYINAPAIIFPYVRAYISTLTNLSTAGFSVTIPTLRMDFKEQLKDKIKVEE